jgi:hypothetical protein
VAAEEERVMSDKGLDFSQALLLMKEGKRVWRRGWADNKYPNNRKLSIELTREYEFYVRYACYNSIRGLIPAEDILADDWEEVPTRTEVPHTPKSNEGKVYSQVGD